MALLADCTPGFQRSVRLRRHRSLGFAYAYKALTIKLHELAAHAEAIADVHGEVKGLNDLMVERMVSLFVKKLPKCAVSHRPQCPPSLPARAMGITCACVELTRTHVVRRRACAPDALEAG